MDIFAHVLWTDAVYYKKYKNDKKQFWWVSLFSIVPDLLTFSPVFIYSFFTQTNIFTGGSVWARYAHEAYNYTHSLVLWAIVIAVVLLIRKGKMWWPLFAPVVHICIDIFTHKGFYETPFLFPLSDYRFAYGISWADQTFMIINYTALAIVYVAIFYLLRKKSISQP